MTVFFLTFQSLSVHDEFEKLLTVFPSRQDKETYKKPHGYKLKNKLRDIAKIANKDVAVRLKTRRSFITSELSNLRKILLISPGLIGPKYPLILAACAFAKFECINYFLHIDKADMIRRDCRRLYVPEKFVSPSITTLLWELAEMAKLVRKYRCIVTAYNAEFINKNDVAFLDPVYQQLSNKYSLLKPLMDYCMQAMKTLNTGAINSWTDSSLLILRDVQLPTTFDEDTKQLEGKFYPDYTGSEVSLYEGLRLNIDRILMMMSTNTMPCFASDPYLSDQFTSRISAVYQRSYSIDAIDTQINTVILPYECYWFRSHFLVAHTNALTYQGKMPYAEQSLVYLHLTKYSVLSAHPDNIDEHERLHEAAFSTCQGMVQSLTQHIVTQVEYMVDVCKSLDSETRPIEAGNRLQKVLDAKKKRSAEPIQFLPGNESLLWAKESMSKFKTCRSNLNTLVGVINNNRFFHIRNKYYDLHVTIMKNVYGVLESKFQSLFFPAGASTNSMERSSYARNRVWSLCGTLQASLSCLTYSTYFVELFRETLVKELIDSTVPLPGNLIPHTMTIPYLIQNDISTKDGRGKTIQITIDRKTMPLVWRVATYFEALIDNMSSRSKASVHVYVEKLKSIVPLATGRNNAVTTPDVDTKVNFEDLRQLCTFIGPQGVRAIDTHLLQLISAKVWKISTFLVTNKSFLTQLRDDYASAIKNASQVKNFEELENVLIYVGLCINIRSMLHRALAESMELVAPGMCVTLQAIRNSFISEDNLAAFGPINTVCADLGFLTPLDIPLIQSLSPVFNASTAENIWKLFPVAAASIFMSDKWESAQYVFAYDAYDKNEHCMMSSIAKLLMCMSTIPSIIDPQALNINSGKRLFQILPENFLRLSSQILLQLRLMDNAYGYTNRPLRSMLLLLESFVQYTPFMDQKYLESCVPYSILHSSRIDVSLGRNRYNDTLLQFAKSRRDNQFASLSTEKESDQQSHN